MNKNRGGGSLKDENLKPLGLIVVADVALFTWAMTPLAGIALSRPTTYLPLFKHLTLMSLSGIVALLLSNILSSHIKLLLVFWKRMQALPGHRAFSYYIHRDPRINIDILKRRIGEFPTDPAAQNSAWYKIFKETEKDPGVEHTHRVYLLFRDLAAISALLFLAGLIVSLFLHKLLELVLIATILQYALSTIAARNSAERLVLNVLALASIKDKKAKSPEADVETEEKPTKKPPRTTSRKPKAES